MPAVLHAAALALSYLNNGMGRNSFEFSVSILIRMLQWINEIAILWIVNNSCFNPVLSRAKHYLTS